MRHGEVEPAGDSRTVADRLRRVRARRFVGRRAELALFGAALAADEPPFAVLFVHGPGGVGKTALLKRLAGIAADMGRAVAEVDLRTTGASPPAVRRAVGPIGARHVILLDTYEAARGLDGWLRETFVPELSAGALLVIASRIPPGRPWRADPGWSELLRTIPLRNLPPADARALLRDAGVPEALAGRVAARTRGHPLALSLFVDVIDQRADATRDVALAEAPDVFERLQQAFVADVPSELHRRALHACAHARFATEGLLRAALDVDDAGALFAWLSSLSFIERGEAGLFPHDLVRDVLEADLRWRDPAAYAALRHRVRAHTIARLRGADPADRRAAATDLVFLHRTNPFTAAQWDWASFGTAYADALRRDDRAPLLAMARAHEGEASAAIVAHWLARQPEAFVVVREHDERPRGFMIRLALDRATEADLAVDPGARAMWRCVHEIAPPRPGERVFAARTLIDRDLYQAPSPTLNVVTVVDTYEWIAGTRPSWELIGAWADARAAAPLMSYIDFHRLPAGDYEVGGRRYATFGHDWRRVDADAWLALVGARELADGFDPVAAAAARRPQIALAHGEFVAAVHALLRDLHRDEALATSPLLRSRVAREAAGGSEPTPAVLRELVERAVATLRIDPRDARSERAVTRTYLRPAGTQERAAEALGMPFSTYRRHLRRGVERVADWLWHGELHGLDG